MAKKNLLKKKITGKSVFLAKKQKYHANRKYSGVPTVSINLGTIGASLKIRKKKSVPASQPENQESQLKEDLSCSLLDSTSDSNINGTQMSLDVCKSDNDDYLENEEEEELEETKEEEEELEETKEEEELEETKEYEEEIQDLEVHLEEVQVENEQDQKKKLKLGKKLKQKKASVIDVMNSKIIRSKTHLCVAHIGIKDKKSLILRGKFTLEVLKGGVFINGSRILTGDKPILISSPITHPTYEIFSVSHDCEHISQKNLNKYKNEINQLSSYNTIILLNGQPGKIPSLPGFGVIYDMNKKLDQSICRGVWKCGKNWCYRDDYGYDAAVNQIFNASALNTSVITCGGQNVGKSSFNRLLINQLLSRFPCVYYLECDIGQTEFTPPGLVSLNRVTKPLFEPPFEHQETPLISSSCGLHAPKNDPDRYLETIKYVFSYYKKLGNDEGAPLIVNTMGWTSHLGYVLLVDIIRTIQPTFLTEFYAKNRNNRNYKTPLVPEKVNSDVGWTSSVASPMLSYKRLFVPVTVCSVYGTKFTSAHFRNLSFLSYFSKNKAYICQNYYMKKLLAQPTAVIQLDDISIFNGCYEPIKKKMVFAALNASVVAMCSTKTADSLNLIDKDSEYLPKAPICQCLGLGIVRGVDPESGLIYIISNLDEMKLAEVDGLVFGNHQIPKYLLDKPNEGTLTPQANPYVSTNFSPSIIGSEYVKQRRKLLPLSAIKKRKKKSC